MTTTSETTIQTVSASLLNTQLPGLQTATFPITSLDTVLVRVRTTGGHEGVAWSFVFGADAASSVAAMVRHLAELAIGRDAGSTEAVRHLWQRISRAAGFFGRAGITALAMSAIDTACWDIAGQAAGLPVWRLLGGESGTVETYASQGLWLDRTRDELAEEARGLVEQGFHAVKMRAGLPDPDEDVARVAAVREAIGPGVKLMVDANQAWNLKDTLTMARRLEEYDLFWLEEPMDYESLTDYAAARPRIPMPLCTGESNWLPGEIDTLARHRAADYLMPDLMRMGGITGWLDAAHAATDARLPVTPHLFMEHCAHLAAALPNVVWQEYQPWWQNLMQTPLTVKDGRIVLPDEPGFGIHLNLP
jgi:L-alanine-DL-glutamate epimerase-like enolase superfamily enzyme